jgi:Neuraminidase (sialidase)
MQAIGDGAFSGSGSLNEVSTVIETSSDGGKTWQHEDLFNGVPGGTFPLTGCDGESLHVAGYVSGQDKTIIVRSFTRGDFAATPLPPWYKPAPASAAKPDF